MVLTAVLEGGDAITKDEWELSRLLSREDLKGDDRERRAWAHSNLIELELLALLIPVLNPDPARPRADIGEQVRQLLRAVGLNSPEIHSTRRQLLRYEEFFQPIAIYAANSAKRSFDSAQWGLVVTGANDAFEKLPETTRFE
jgi:hypothetical protein